MRQQLQLLVLIGLVMGLALVGYRVLFGERPVFELTVVSATAARVGPQGAGRPGALGVGDIVDIDDVVSTGPGGSAAMQYGAGSQIMLGESASMRLLEADKSGVRIELDEGEVTARVREGAPPLDIANRGRTVRATDADFTVMVSRGGGLSATSTRGKLGLSGFDGIRGIVPGQAVHENHLQKPEIRSISESLLLDVEWPVEERTRRSEVEVTGQTNAYATVTVGRGDAAVVVRADRDGRFRATIGLEEGKNEVQLRVRDVSGREATRVQTVRRDSTAPVIQAAEVVWGP